METVDSWLFNTFWGQVTITSVLLGMVTFAVWAILTERLFGRTTVDRIAKERDDWKQAYFTETEAHRVTQQSLRDATNSLEITDTVIKHLRAVTPEKSSSE